MKCPHCEQEVPLKTCAECGGSTPFEGSFCMLCGEAFAEKGAAQGGESEDDLDLDDRVLCPDGTCTGIIVDGRCSECGRSPEAQET